jgi:hypothetical protein
MVVCIAHKIHEVFGQFQPNLRQERVLLQIAVFP